VAALIHVMCFLLQVRLNGVATFIGKVGLSVAILVFIIQFIRYFVLEFKNEKGDAGKVVSSVLNIFTIAVAIVVVAVPEGLPLAVTLTYVPHVFQLDAYLYLALSIS
jgi:Ca2+-transporting ATPase